MLKRLGLVLLLLLGIPIGLAGIVLFWAAKMMLLSLALRALPVLLIVVAALTLYKYVRYGEKPDWAPAREVDTPPQDVAGKTLTFVVSDRANRELALRYGLANVQKVDGKLSDQCTLRIAVGRRMNHPTASAGHELPATSNCYSAILPTFGHAKVVVILDRCNRVVEGFLPRNPERWFKLNQSLEPSLFNPGLKLTGLARVHARAKL